MPGGCVHACVPRQQQQPRLSHCRPLALPALLPAMFACSQRDWWLAQRRLPGRWRQHQHCHRQHRAHQLHASGAARTAGRHRHTHRQRATRCSLLLSWVIAGILTARQKAVVHSTASSAAARTTHSLHSVLRACHTYTPCCCAGSNISGTATGLSKVQYTQGTCNVASDVRGLHFYAGCSAHMRLAAARGASCARLQAPSATAAAATAAACRRRCCFLRPPSLGLVDSASVVAASLAASASA